MSIRAKTDLVSAFTRLLAVLQTPAEAADVVFFTLPVAKVPHKVLLFKKVREVGAEQIIWLQSWNSPCTARVCATREGRRELVSY